MNNQEKIVERTNDLLKVYVYDGLKKAANDWMAALGTENEKAASRYYAESLEQCVCTIDGVIEFFGSPAAAQRFGAEKAAAILAHAKEVKAAGGKYCDCPGCTAALAVLDFKADLMA